MADRIRVDDSVLTVPENKKLNIPKPKIKKFLYKISLGESRIEAFKDIFPKSKNWAYNTIYAHINSILIKEYSREFLKEYRDKMIDLFDQRKIELIGYLENQIYDDPTRTFFEKMKAIEIYLKLMESFKDKNAEVINNINITTEKTKENKVKEIFGINDEIIDADIKEDSK